MHRPLASWLLLVASLSGPLLLVGCGDPSTPTQIVLRIDLGGDLKVPCDLDRLDVEIPGVDAAETRAALLTGRAEIPLQVTLVDNGSREPFEVTVVALRGETQRVITQRVKLPGFRAGKAQLAEVTLTGLCGDDCALVDRSTGTLPAYTAADTREPAKCNVGPVDCEPEGCGEDEECFDGVCRNVNVARYVVSRNPAGQLPIACERFDNEEQVVEILGGAGTVDARAYVDFQARAGQYADSGLRFFFYGRRVFGAWVGVDGWVLFDFTPGEDAQAPTPGADGNSNANVSLSSAEAPAGIYPFWSGLRLHDTISAVCVSRISDDDWTPAEGETAPPLKSIQIAWDYMCFAGVEGCPGDRTQERLSFQVVLDAASSDTPLPGESGRVSVGWGGSNRAHRSAARPDEAVYGRDQAMDRYVTVGLKDSIAAACEAHTGDVADDDDATIEQRCDVFSGRCPDGSPCGFSQLPDLFYARGDASLLLQSESFFDSPDDALPPAIPKGSLVFTPAEP